MTPGSDEYFRMFLSSRWGVSTAEIDELPLEEFLHQKVFWEKYRWGLFDDLMAMLLSQFVSHRTGSKPETDLWAWKNLALHRSTMVIKKVTDTSLESIKKGFMMMAEAIGVEKK